ncbi:MAG: hypothetical protein GX159_08020 [Flavobacteriaceae bacterium]|nr:hypothetical protein [Flavobacteriaceae bacterium]
MTQIKTIKKILIMKKVFVKGFALLAVVGLSFTNIACEQKADTTIEAAADEAVENADATLESAEDAVDAAITEGEEAGAEALDNAAEGVEAAADEVEAVAEEIAE